MPELERAGFGIRVLAGIVDSIIIVLPIGMMIYLSTGEILINWTQGLAFNLTYLFYLTFLPVYWNGYVIGKKIMNIRIVKLDGTDLSLSDMVMREVIGKVLLGYATFGITTVISGLMVLLRHDKRAIHDLLAGTFVENEF
ncbi:RDD family protein [Marinilactibacillus psychrotolerans]|uniref:RDD family protein n=1 Tax=Marinilactibacillus psychrotolerans TaxID=191770 RepID=A0ABW8UQ95_9LACT